MTKDEAIAALDQIDERGDTEHDHAVADQILVEFLRANGHPEVADAWERAEERAGFWYA